MLNTFNFFLRSFCLEEISFRESKTRWSRRTENIKQIHIIDHDEDVALNIIDVHNYNFYVENAQYEISANFILDILYIKLIIVNTCNIEEKYHRIPAILGKIIRIPAILRKNISICGVWWRAIFCTRDLIGASL